MEDCATTAGTASSIADSEYLRENFIAAYQERFHVSLKPYNPLDAPFPCFSCYLAHVMNLCRERVCETC